MVSSQTPLPSQRPWFSLLGAGYTHKHEHTPRGFRGGAQATPPKSAPYKPFLNAQPGTSWCAWWSASCLLQDFKVLQNYASLNNFPNSRLKHIWMQFSTTITEANLNQAAKKGKKYPRMSNICREMLDGKWVFELRSNVLKSINPCFHNTSITDLHMLTLQCSK